MEKQFAVVSRGQLLALGMNDNAMQYRVRSGGPWQALLPGVYLGVTGAPNLLQKEMAAQLYAGPDSLITGPTALFHYGVRGVEHCTSRLSRSAASGPKSPSGSKVPWNAASSVPLFPSAPSLAQQRTVRVNECGSLPGIAIRVSHSLVSGPARAGLKVRTRLEVPVGPGRARRAGPRARGPAAADGRASERER